MTSLPLHSQDSIPQHVAAALSQAQNSSEAIRNLYLSFKERNQRYSIPYICKKAGISSQGYLSDVIHGKRTLHLKYKVGILRALELKGAAARCLKTLIEIDHQKDPVLAAKLERRLLVQKKALTIEHRSISHDMAQFFLALEVFCAFGLFNNKPTLQNLVNYFASQSAGDLHRAVLLLKELKLIEMDREHYVVSTGQVNFSGERFSQIDYLKLAFKQGIQSIDKWYAYPDYALFESINMSVKKSELLKYLPTVRQNTEDLRLGLETEDGDMVVRLNLQIYPVE